MPDPKEKLTEAPKTSPATPPEVIAHVNNFLAKLKSDVEKKTDPEEKKKLVRESVVAAALSKEQREELGRRVESQQSGLPHELLEELVGVLDLTDERKAQLRAKIEADAKEPKTFGDRMKSGVDTVTGWFKTAFDWTGKGVGKGWKGFVAGLSAVGSAIGTGWSWLREKTAQMFGSLAASVDEYLPDMIKKPLNFLMGEYGVLYKNFAKFKIEVTSADENESPSLQPFMEKFSVIAVTGQNITFDEYCRLVALKLREDPARRTVIPLKVTQQQLEQAADQVIAQKIAQPSAPAAAPVAAPAAIPAVASASASDATTAVPERREVTALTIAGIEVAKVEKNGEALLKVGAKEYRVKPNINLYLFSVAPQIKVTKLEELRDGTVEIAGSVIGISGTVALAKEELTRVIQSLNSATATRDEEVTCRLNNGAPQARKITFELVPSA